MEELLNRIANEILGEVLTESTTEKDLTMANAEKNIKFLNALDSETKAKVLANIASHYGISTEKAYEEVTDDEVEHLLDYVTGDERAATQVLMQRHNCI